MTKNSLKDLYVEQVQDMHSACDQALDITRRMADAASSPALQEALLDGVRGIERGRDTMDQIATAHDAAGNGSHCKAMEGLVAEAQHDIFEEEYGDDDVRDAAIVAMYQRMAHYAISGYGTIRAMAGRLGLEKERDAVQVCLDKSYDGDQRFTDLATGDVNPAAA